MRERAPIVLLDGATKAPVEAVLIEDVTVQEIRQADETWAPFLRQALRDDAARGLPPGYLPEHAHWVWERKWRSATPASRFFGIECEGEMQALMAVRIDKTCRLPEHQGLPLVYVDYLAAAPWNLPEIAVQPRFRRCGLILISAAIQLSHEEGYNGRIGLHSLPQAEDFYRVKCGMTDLGRDTDYEDLRYLETTAVQAQALVERAN